MKGEARVSGRARAASHCLFRIAHHREPATAHVQKSNNCKRKMWRWN